MHLLLPPREGVQAVEARRRPRAQKGRVRVRALVGQRARLGHVVPHGFDRGRLPHAILLRDLAEQIAHKRRDLGPIVHLLHRMVLGDATAGDALTELVEGQHRLRRVAGRLPHPELLRVLAVHEGCLADRHREAALDMRAVSTRVGGDLRKLLDLPLAAHVDVGPRTGGLVRMSQRLEPFVEAELVVLVRREGRALQSGVPLLQLWPERREGVAHGGLVHLLGAELRRVLALGPRQHEIVEHLRERERHRHKLFRVLDPIAVHILP